VKGPALLALRHAAHNRVQTIVLVLCFTVTMFLPLATRTIIARYSASLTARAEQTPLVAGAKGNRFDLTLAALYFRQSDLDPMTYGDFEQVVSYQLGVTTPVHARFTARGIPIVATSPEYFEQRHLVPDRGTLPLQLGDVVLGARVARELALAPGDALFSDQKDVYDISKPPALKMRVCGVLAPAGESPTPDDDAVFVDIGTAWILEGAAHGHDEPRSIDESLLLGKTDEHVTVGPAMIEYNEVTENNVGSYHFHGDRSKLPLTAVIAFPPNAKSATILRERVNQRLDAQMVVPSDVISDLMAFVFRIKTLFDAIAVVLGVCTILLTGLVVLLSLRIRAGEIATLNRIGCARYTVTKLVGLELVLVLMASALLAFAGAWLLSEFAPELSRVL
jgi:putative ABC transport system permease protein